MSKLAGILLMVIAVVATIVAAAAVAYMLSPNNIATVNGLQMYFNGIRWANETVTDWGFLNPDQSVIVPFNVTSFYESQNMAIALILPDLPLDWTAVWTLNGTTVIAGSEISGAFTLHVSATALPKDYQWTMIARTNPVP